jgi:trimeric autotransporter adhesin
MLRKVLTVVSLSLVFGILTGGVCFGQIKSGTINGRVTDAGGAVVPEAKVSVVEAATKVVTVTKTSDVGEYTVPFLEPAIYDVSVAKEGFKTYTQTGVTIGTDTTVQVDVQLTIGRTATVVEVRSGGAALQSEIVTVGDSVGSEVIDNVPNINQNPLYYATLQPGVTARWTMLDTTSFMSFGIGMYGRAEFSEFSVNGGEAFTAGITVDGINVQGMDWNEANILPNPDAIQEVRTSTNSYDASMGRGQGNVAIVTKSGADHYHGSVFGRWRNDAFNANSFANNQQGIAKVPFKVGYFGGTIGGPIKKDKAFFFVSYQGLAHNTARQDLLNVPTDLQKAGNFSQTLVAVSGVATPVQLFNPYQATLVSSGLWQHPAYANAIITNPDPYMLNLVSSYPEPNHTPIDVYNDDNYFFQGVQTYRGNNINSRVDYTRRKNSYYATGGIELGNIHTPGPWGTNVPYYYPPLVNGAANANDTALIKDKNPYVAVGDTISLSPTLVVDLRMGMQRTASFEANNLYPNFNYNAVGVPPAIQAILPIPGATPMTITTAPWTDLDSSTNSHKDDHQTNWNLVGAATKVKGNWTLKFGGEYFAVFASSPNPFYSGSSFDDDGCAGCQYSGASYASVSQNTTVATQGLQAAGLLMGAAWQNISAANSGTISPAQAAKYGGFYTQNTWKATPRLTLNLGLRWEVQPASTERFNRMTSWNDNGTNPIGTADGIGAQGALAFVGTGGYSRHLWNTSYNNFGPRLGVAYRITNSLVVRGGYGISYVPTNTGLLAGGGIVGMYPWGTGTTSLPFGTNPQGVVVAPVENPIVSPIYYPPGPNTSAPQVYGAAPTNLYPRNYLNGRVQQWNAFFEKKVGAWLFSAGYVASNSDHLPYFGLPLNGENNLLPASLQTCYHAGLNCPASDSSVAAAGGFLGTGVDPYSQTVPNPFNPTGKLPFGGTYLTTTLPRGTVDGLYPLFSGYPISRSIGFANWNALELEAKHQFGHGLTLDVFYTWSKELDYSSFEAENNQGSEANSTYGSAENLLNLRANRKLGANDIPQRFLANIVYSLPFGGGRAFNPQNRIARALVSGWGIGAVELDESGYPIGVSSNSTGSLDARSNRSTESFQVPKALQHWYNGTTKVTLPDGNVITPAANTFLKYNIGAFTSPYIANPTNSAKYINDTYWTGNQAIDYSEMREPSLNNLNFTLKRSFKLTERVGLEFSANATNVFNHPNFETYTMSLGGAELTPGNATSTPLGVGTTSTTYGTHTNVTFDSRQLEFDMKIKF